MVFLKSKSSNSDDARSLSTAENPSALQSHKNAQNIGSSDDPQQPPEEDDFNIEDVQPPREVLQQIFTPEVFNGILSKCGLPDKSPLSEALKHVAEKSKSQNFGDQTTAKDRLDHFGIRSQQPRGFRSGLARLCLGLFRGRLTPSTELAYLQDLARLYSATGGVAGDAPRQTQNKVPQDVDDITHGSSQSLRVMLSLVRGNELVTRGTGKVSTRVVKGVGKGFLVANEGNDIVYLYHGTSIEHATSIVKEGPNHGSPATDFGSAFYLTNSFAYALEAAYEVSGGKAVNHRNLDPTVLVFPVSCAALSDDDSALTLMEFAEWCQVVQSCRRSKLREGSLFVRLAEARCVIGRISANAEVIDRGGPACWIENEVLQYAFKGHPHQNPMAELRQALREGHVQVIRILQESENEWDAEQVALFAK